MTPQDHDNEASTKHETQHYPKLLEYNGEWKSLEQHSKAHKKSYQLVYYRLKKGMSLHDALTKPILGRGRSVLHYEHNGNFKTLTDHAEDYGLSYYQLYSRLKKGMSLEEALTMVPCDTPAHIKKYKHNGELKTLKQHAEAYGFDYHQVYNRLRRGMSLDDALTTPINESKSHVRIVRPGVGSHFSDYSKGPARFPPHKIAPK